MRRLTGMAYEALLLVGVLLLAFVLPHVLIGALTRFLASPGVLWAHLFLVLCVYFTWFWTHGGQTLGMRAWKIRVVDLNNQPLTWTQAGMRFFWSLISWMVFGLGYVWALFDPEQLTLHDRMSKTRLVRVADNKTKK